MPPNQEIQEIEAFLDQILGILEQTMQSGEEIPDALLAELAQIFNEATQRINELEQTGEQIPTPIPPTTSAPAPPPATAPAPAPATAPAPAPAPAPTSAPPPPIAPPPATATNLEPGPYPSSNINAFKYDPESGQLVVKFQDKFPGQNGPVYAYDNVPAYIFDIFRRGAVAPKTSGQNAWHRWKEGVTPSLGASMYALIRAGGYPYQRIS